MPLSRVSFNIYLTHGQLMNFLIAQIPHGIIVTHLWAVSQRIVVFYITL